MNRRLLPLLLLPALLLTLTSCNSLKHTYSLDETLSRPSGNNSATVTLPAINNEQPAGELTTNPVDIHRFIETFCTDQRDGSYYSLYDVAVVFGIECLRENDAGVRYSIHSVKQGGQLLVFYLNEENNCQINRWFYRQKPLSSADFSDIQVGSSLRDVINIDPAAQVFENICRSDPEAFEHEKGYGYLGSWHYLEDQILEIAYRHEDGDFIVTDLLPNENFQCRAWNQDISYLHDVHILPIDRLPT